MTFQDMKFNAARGLIRFITDKISDLVMDKIPLIQNESEATIPSFSHHLILLKNYFVPFHFILFSFI